MGTSVRRIALTLVLLLGSASGFAQSGSVANATFTSNVASGAPVDFRDTFFTGTSVVYYYSELLGLAAANGFFFAALFGLARTLLSGYWKLRQQAGLTRYSEDEIKSALARSAFSAERAEHNLGHNQARMAYVAKPA
jgi:hypothetical protein